MIELEKYLKQIHVPEAVVKMKMDSYAKHKDIAKEFEYWISQKEYLQDNCVEVEGYTAKALAESSVLLDGEGAFALLIELRENPKKAIKKISKGFKLK